MKYTFIYMASIAMMTLTNCKNTKKEEPVNEEEKPVAFEMSNIDSTVSPCDNFYQYAVGNWMKNNPVPSTESRWSSFNILDKANREKITAIVMDAVAQESPEKGSNAQLIADLYRSAMDTVLLEKKGVSALKTVFGSIDKISDAKNFASTLAQLRTKGIGSPVAFYVGRDSKNSEQYITTFSQSGLSLPDKEYYLSNEDKYATIRSQYVDHIDKMFALAGLNVADAGEKILALEVKIAALYWDRTELREPEKSYNKMDRVSFVNSFKNLDLNSYLGAIEMPSFDTLIVGQPSFYKGLDKLVNKDSYDSWRVYLKWKAIDSYGPWANKDLEQQNFEFFSKQLKGIKEMKPREERVIRMVDGRLGEPLGKLFVEKHFPKESKDYMVKLIENLRSAYAVRIKNLTWMGDSTKEKALKKLTSFTYKIGYPEEWKDYSKLEITSDNLLENLMNCSEFGFNLMVERLGKPVDKKEWFMTPQTVNAYYSSSGNEVVFPAGILQPPFFHPDFDDAINYGGIGAVIGHEFTHGFDDKGSKSDWNGNLNNWWTENDRTRFDALTGELASQFDGYEPIPGMHVNGKMTLGENIADLGGLTLAYAALEKDLGSKKEVGLIDGFTWQQRFFLGWANIWKMTMTEDELRNRLLTDYHSPGEYRVNGPLANLPEFSQAFGCEGKSMVKPDSTMIKIW